MPLVLKMPGFWLKKGSEYTRVVNMPLVLKMPGFWIYQGSEYATGSEVAKVLNKQGFWICQGYTGFWICLNMSACMCLHMAEYAEICMNMPKSAWMAFALYFPLWSTYLFQRLHKTRSFSLKDNVFLEIQNLIFPIVALILFVFFQTKYFRK